MTTDQCELVYRFKVAVEMLISTRLWGNFPFASNMVVSSGQQANRMMGETLLRSMGLTEATLRTLDHGWCVTFLNSTNESAHLQIQEMCRHQGGSQPWPPVSPVRGVSVGEEEVYRLSPGMRASEALRRFGFATGGFVPSLSEAAEEEVPAQLSMPSTLRLAPNATIQAQMADAMRPAGVGDIITMNIMTGEVSIQPRAEAETMSGEKPAEPEQPPTERRLRMRRKGDGS